MSEPLSYNLNWGFGRSLLSSDLLYLLLSNRTFCSISRTRIFVKKYLQLKDYFSFPTSNDQLLLHQYLLAQFLVVYQELQLRDPLFSE